MFIHKLHRLTQVLNVLNFGIIGFMSHVINYVLILEGNICL